MDKQNLLVITRSFPDKDNKFIGGIFIKEQLKALSKFFDDIYVLVPLPYGIQLKRKVNFMDYIIPPNINVHFIKYFNFPLFYKIGKKYWVNLEKRAVLKWLNNNKIVNIDIVHAHYTFPSGAVAVEIKKLLNVPVVITEHAHVSLYPLIAKKDPIILNTWKYADAVIRVNKKDIELFRQLVPSTNFIYIPNGYTPNRIKYINKKYARMRLGIPENVKIIFNLAGLYPYKGHEYLIKAMSLIVKKRDDVVCYIGGEGPLKNKLQKQIKKLNLQNYVKLIGFVPDEELKYWMNAADLFVLPSLSESFGIVQLEAMSVGVPVVATYNGGSEEIIISNDYGLLCPPADSDCLAEKILIALNKEWDREKIRKYAEQFTWEKITKQILEIYKKLLE